VRNVTFRHLFSYYVLNWVPHDGKQSFVFLGVFSVFFRVFSPIQGLSCSDFQSIIFPEGLVGQPPSSQCFNQWLTIINHKKTTINHYESPFSYGFPMVFPAINLYKPPFNQRLIKRGLLENSMASSIRLVPWFSRQRQLAPWHFNTAWIFPAT